MEVQVGTAYKKPVYANEDGEIYYKLGEEIVHLDRQATKTGNERVRLLKSGTKRSSQHCVDRLVAHGFLGPSNAKIIHIDNDIKNNKLENIRYYTQLDQKNRQKEYNKTYTQDKRKYLVGSKELRSKKRKHETGIPNVGYIHRGTYEHKAGNGKIVSVVHCKNDIWYTISDKAIPAEQVTTTERYYYIKFTPYISVKTNTLEKALEIREAIDNARWGKIDDYYKYTEDDRTGQIDDFDSDHYCWIGTEEKGTLKNYESLQDLLDNITDLHPEGYTSRVSRNGNDYRDFNMETCMFDPK